MCVHLHKHFYTLTTTTDMLLWVTERLAATPPPLNLSTCLLQVSPLTHASVVYWILNSHGLTPNLVWIPCVHICQQWLQTWLFSDQQPYVHRRAKTLMCSCQFQFWWRRCTLPLHWFAVSSCFAPFHTIHFATGALQRREQCSLFEMSLTSLLFFESVCNVVCKVFEMSCHLCSEGVVLFVLSCLGVWDAGESGRQHSAGCAHLLRHAGSGRRHY